MNLKMNGDFPLLIILYVCYFLSASLIVALIGYFWWRKQQTSSITDSTENHGNINDILVQPMGYLENQVVVLSRKENNVDDVKTCRFFFQPEYLHVPLKLNALGAILHLGSEDNEYNVLFPVKGSLFLKVYRGPSLGNGVKNKISVGLAGEGKRSYLMVNDVVYHFVLEVEMAYDYSKQPVGIVTLMQPPPGSYGICSYIKREQNGIRLLRTSFATKSLAGLLQSKSSALANGFYHQLILPLSSTGYSVATDHIIAWLPNSGLIDWPQLVPPLSFLFPPGSKGKPSHFGPMEQSYPFDTDDITDKFLKWVGMLKESPEVVTNGQNEMEFKVKYRNLKVGRRLCSGWGEYFAHVLTQQSYKQVEPDFQRFVLNVLAREMAPYLSVFAVRKSEPLGKGVLFLQSESDPITWSRPYYNDLLLNRQWVVSYCSLKELKRLLNSNHPPFASLDREHIFKVVSELNLKTQLGILMAAGPSHAHFLVLPIIPSYDLCRKCLTISNKVDVLLINWDLQITKFSTIDLSFTKRNF